MDHGLLRVRLPRATRPTPRTITVGRTGPRSGGLSAGTPMPADPGSGPGAAPPGHRRRDRPAVAGRVVTPSVLGPTAERVPDVRRIAVLRANALGDFIFALPALDALRAAYPSAEIVLLGAPWHAKLWRDRPGPVDRVLVVPPAPGIRDAGARASRSRRWTTSWPRPRRGTLRPGGADPRRRRQLQPAGQSALGARVTVGLRAEDAPPLDRWLRYVYYQHEVIRYLEVVALVGRAGHHHRADAGGDRRRPGRGRRRCSARAGRPRVALHPGCHRHPPPLARRALRRGGPCAGTSDGYEVLVTGTPAEREVVDRVVAAAAGAGAPAGRHAQPRRAGRLLRRLRVGRLQRHRPAAPGRRGGRAHGGHLLGRQPDQRGDPAARPAPADRLLDGALPGLRGRLHTGDLSAPARRRRAARTGTRSSPTYRWSRCWRPPASCSTRVAQAGCGVSSSARTTSHASTSRSVTVVGDSRWYAPLGRTPAPP